MMEKIRGVISEYKVFVIPIVAFLFGFYIQHLNNISKIEALELKHAALEKRITDTYTQLDQIKLDKQTFETYTATVSDMKVSINEIQKDIKTILAKGKY